MIKVGDKAKVRNDLEVGTDYGNWLFTDGMSKYIDKFVTIIYEFVDGDYKIKEDGGQFAWSEEMLIELEEELLESEDNVNSPDHYKQGKYETIEVIEDIVEDFESYCLGNIIKYISRYKYKNGVEDLNKAKWYLEKLIEKVD